MLDCTVKNELLRKATLRGCIYNALGSHPTRGHIDGGYGIFRRIAQLTVRHVNICERNGATG